jgi:peroxiredoxin
MGRAAQAKKARRVAPPPVKTSAAAARTSRTRRILWLATGGPAIAIGLVVAYLLGFHSPSAPPPSKNVSAWDKNASPSLVKAAQNSGYYPTTEAGVGTIEGKPPSAAQPPSNPKLLPVGSAAPNFTLKAPTGQTVSLSQYRGKAILLEFFATWCPHCNAEAPHLRALAQSLPTSRYQFVSVNADSEDAASVFAYHSYHGLPFPALLDPGAQAGSFKHQGGPGPVTTKYRVEAYPTFYVIGRNGRITWRSDGEQPDALLRQELVKAANSG